MVDFSFLEYSFDPSVADREKIHSSLNRLGFVHRTQHRSDTVGFWVQNQCIILLREDANGSEPHISGLGFIAPPHIIENDDIYFDQQSNIYITEAPGGLRILFVPENYTESLMTYHYDMVDKKKYATSGLELFSGVILSNAADEVREYFLNLGFKLNKTSDRYFSLVSNNRRFTLMLDRRNNSNEITTVICDTADVFRTTACFTVTGVPMREFVIDTGSLNFGSMNHKIVGYNCLAIGDEESYTIENFVDDAIGSSDLIFRMRKKFLHINENTLQIFYDDREYTTSK